MNEHNGTSPKENGEVPKRVPYDPAALTKTMQKAGEAAALVPPLPAPAKPDKG